MYEDSDVEDVRTEDCTSDQQAVELSIGKHNFILLPIKFILKTFLRSEILRHFYFVVNNSNTGRRGGKMQLKSRKG